MSGETLAPERWASCGRALERAVERARRAGHPVLCCHREALDDAPAATEVFARAEQHAERRFLMSRPARDVERVAVGCVERATCTSSDAFEVLAARAERLREAGAEDATWVGGLAFEPRPERDRAECWRPFGNASFALPELLLERHGRARSLTFATWVTPDTPVRPTLERVARWLTKPGPDPSPDTGPERPAPSKALGAYRARVEAVLRAIREGRADKVVVACEQRLRARSGWSPARALRALQEAHPDCTTFAQGIGASTFLGATPELLVRRAGLEVESAAVAATAPRDLRASAEASLAQALWSSSKERAEHAWVVDAIAQSLRPLCRELAVPESPRILRTGSLQHLHTPISGTLERPRHVLELARRLHPTPALGGHPRPRALALIRDHEGFDRGWYAGPIGWFDARGDGELWVALRCALARRGELRLYAGSGLVADSDAERESQETALKLSSIREAIEPW